jgi:hypothetical protein
MVEAARLTSIHQSMPKSMSIPHQNGLNFIIAFMVIQGRTAALHCRAIGFVTGLEWTGVQYLQVRTP